MLKSASQVRNAAHAAGVPDGVVPPRPPGHRTQSEKLARDIADAIMAGTFRPGDRLDEQSLADRYGVSRTPVREALRQLASSGLIEMRPHRGAIVAQITPDRLETMFGAMGELEATCARLSALCMTPIERRRLQSQQEAMAEIVAAGDTDAFAEANIAWHAMIYAGTHNAIIAEMALTLRQRLGPYRRAQFRRAGRLPQSQAEHGAVVAAVLAGDAAAAHAAMLHHVSLVEESFGSLLAANAA